MQVFLSWSGTRSKAVAEALRDWLPMIIQVIEPWISVDIEKGSRWSGKIADQLEKSKFGIFCLTKDNLESTWMHFEAGALAKTPDAFVWTFLLDVELAEVKQPLGSFQHTKFDKDDFWKLLQTINETARTEGGKVPNEATLFNLYETFWPQLEEKLNAVKNVQQDAQVPQRSDRDILEEILTTIRIQTRRQGLSTHREESDTFRDNNLSRLHGTNAVERLDDDTEVFEAKKGRRIHNLNDALELWPAVLVRMKKKIGITSVAYLQDALPIEVNDSDFVLQFKKEFHYAKACDAAKRLPFEQVLHQCTALPLRLVFRLKNQEGEPTENAE